MSTKPHRTNRRRTLLALESSVLPQEIQTTALRVCIDLNTPLDILVTEPQENPASRAALLPTALLLRLEHSGTDYRIARMQGPLSHEIQRYLARGRSACTVIVASTGVLATPCLADIQAGGHQLIDLSRPPAPPSRPQTEAAAPAPLLTQIVLT